MKKSLLYIGILLLIISITLIGVRVHPTIVSVYTTVSVYPASYKAEDIGVIFQINVTIQNVTDLAGYEFRLGYDTSVLNATSIDYGGIFGSTYFPLISVINNTEGWLRYSIMEDFGEPAFNGSGVLAIITFNATGFGSTVLDLYDIKLGDSAVPPNPILHTVIDGFFFNEAFHDITVTDVKAYPGEVKASELITINVTVTNEGNFSETFNVVVYADIEAYKYTYAYEDGPVTDITVVVGDEITVGTLIVTDLAPSANTTQTFTWNTTGVEEGNYTMSTKSLLLDDDTRDNMFIGDIVTINPPALVHDIAITNVVPSPTEVTIGENVTIDVTVKNEGNFSETFDIAVYYEDTAIANQTDITLTNGTSTTLTFAWDTTGVPEGTYTISAKVPPVEGEREVDKADNTYIDGTVVVRGVPAPNFFIYAVVVVAVIIVVAVAIYFVKFR